MKKIPLIKGKFALVDDEDYHYLKRFNWQYVFDAGVESVRRTLIYRQGSHLTKENRPHINLEDFIVLRPIGGKHNFIFKNGNRLDFRKKNLDFIGIFGIKHRSVKRAKCFSIYKGVTKNYNHGHWSKTLPYRGQIEIGKRGTEDNKIFIRLFKTEKETAKWYNEKAKELYGKYAYQNKIE